MVFLCGRAVWPADLCTESPRQMVMEFGSLMVGRDSLCLGKERAHLIFTKGL